MQNSQDKNLMQDMHGSIESSTQNINQAFKSALNESLCMQDTVYQQMKSKGWYQTEQAEQEKIDTLKQKFSNQMMG